MLTILISLQIHRVCRTVSPGSRAFCHSRKCSFNVSRSHSRCDLLHTNRKFFYDLFFLLQSPLSILSISPRDILRKSMHSRMTRLCTILLDHPMIDTLTHQLLNILRFRPTGFRPINSVLIAIFKYHIRMDI